MERNSGKPNAESRSMSRPALPVRSALRFLHSASPSRGITLIELLITITIIAIISAAILGTASAAMEAGRRSRTRTTIEKINGLLMERWDSYANRRVDVSPVILDDIETKFNNGQITAVQRGQMIADARLLALRELMKMEMPDRWSDVINQDMQPNAPLNNSPYVLASVPALTQAYRRQLFAMQNAGANYNDILANQHAECLYMTIMQATGDGEARTHFTPQDIGDVDGDGAPEFLDGWGNPIGYFRWPAGFIVQSVLMTGDAEGDHDPFDVYRRDSPAAALPPAPDPSMYPPPMIGAIQQLRRRNQQGAQQNDPRLLASRLVPLVYSNGPDERGGLRIEQPERDTGLDPYFVMSDDVQMAQPDAANEDWVDNIHNHLSEF